MELGVSTRKLVLFGERVMVTIPPRRSLHPLDGLGKIGVIDNLAAVFTDTTLERQLNSLPTVLVSERHQLGIGEVQQLHHVQIRHSSPRTDKGPVEFVEVGDTPPGQDSYGCVGRPAIASVAVSRIFVSSSKSMTGSAVSRKSKNSSR